MEIGFHPSLSDSRSFLPLPMLCLSDRHSSWVLMLLKNGTGFKWRFWCLYCPYCVHCCCFKGTDEAVVTVDQETRPSLAWCMAGVWFGGERLWPWVPLLSSTGCLAFPDFILSARNCRTLGPPSPCGE